MSTDVSLIYEQEQFAALQKAATDIAIQCDKITITDATTLAIAHQQLSLANEKLKQIETLRTQLKQPSLEVGRGIDALAKPLSTPIADAIARGKAKIVAWNKSQEVKVVAGNTPIAPVDKPKGMRSTWAFEVVNENEIPRGFMKPDEAKIQAYLDAHKQSLKDGEIKAGIKFFIKQSVTLR
jgi:hypothetical protein